jgi:hypothetical protein
MSMHQYLLQHASLSTCDADMHVFFAIEMTEAVDVHITNVKRFYELSSERLVIVATLLKVIR